MLRSIIVAASLLLSSCTVAEPIEALGSYEARKDGVWETLALNADGTYLLTSATEGRPQAVHAGRWQLSSVAGGCQRIVLANFTSQLADQGRPYVRSGEDWSTCIERSVLGKTRIVVDDDAGTYYVRR